MNNSADLKEFFETKGPKDIERFVQQNLDISQQVYAHLDEKGWSQKEFAKALGKTEAEISKWLSGTHNLTLRSIAKMEAVLDQNIIVTPIRVSSKEQSIKSIKNGIDVV